MSLGTSHWPGWLKRRPHTKGSLLSDSLLPFASHPTSRTLPRSGGGRALTKWGFCGRPGKY